MPRSPRAPRPATRAVAPRIGRRTIGSLVALTLAATALAAAGAAGAEGHDASAAASTTTTAPGSTSSTSTTVGTSDEPAPATTAPHEGSAGPTTSTTAATTSTTARSGAPGAETGDLPPASVEGLPPEESLPPLVAPAVPPAPPPGADDAGRRLAQRELRAVEAALKRARADEAALVKRMEGPAQRVVAARSALQAQDAADRAAAEGLTDARRKMKKMAVAGYVRGGDSQPVDYLLQATDPVDLERRRAIVRTAAEARKDAVDGYAAAQQKASAALEAAVRALDEAEAALAVVQSEVDAAATRTFLLGLAVAEKRLLLDHAAAAATVSGTDVPRLFADAYRRAAATLARRAPHCRVGWTAVAAIGKIESNHGRYRGAQFALNGDVFPRILGIPLDGTRTALIRDTDAGALDTDLEFDRAVGPMQFIPSTWARIDEDGNGDGVRDPNNIYDAALGTAAYLCRAVPSGGLDTDEGLRPAFFAYNHSHAYVEKVLAWAHTYGGVPPAP